MITLTTLVAIWWLVSCKRLKKVDFNPFYGTFFDYFGFTIGTAYLLIAFMFLTVKYLP